MFGTCCWAVGAVRSGIIASARRPPSWYWSDDFNRPDSGDLGADWVTRYDGFRIIGNQVSPLNIGTNLVYTAQAIPSPDAYTEVDVMVWGTTPSPTIWTRFSPEHGGYKATITPTTLSLYRATPAANIEALVATGGAWTLPVRVRIEAEGDQIRGYVNGELLATATDGHFLEAGHGALAGNRSNGRLDNFRMGVL